MSKFEMICCVVKNGGASRALKYAKKFGVEGGTIFLGHGTLKNHLLDKFGFTDVRKEILCMIVKKSEEAYVINGINSMMNFDRANHHGIIFSYDVPELYGSHIGSTDNSISVKEELTQERKEPMYKIIYTVVDRGNGEQVVDAANKAGARGGTIMNGRGAGIHETQTFFNIAVEPEKEVVFIITKNEEKDKIVEAIRNDLEIDKPGNGMMYVMDINEVYGLRGKEL